MNVSLAYPEGFELLPEIQAIADRQAKSAGGSFIITQSMEEAYRDADIVYSKSWAPMQIMLRRTELLRENASDELKQLEKEGLNYNAKFTDWECTEQLMKLTRNGKALYMHCLPADITGVSCKSGEVQKEVFEKYRIQTYLEAGYKPYIIASMIVNNRFSDPCRVLKSMIEKPSNFRTTLTD
jgi:ornithine carbamoyltransferase